MKRIKNFKNPPGLLFTWLGRIHRVLGYTPEMYANIQIRKTECIIASETLEKQKLLNKGAELSQKKAEALSKEEEIRCLDSETQKISLIRRKKELQNIKHRILEIENELDNIEKIFNIRKDYWWKSCNQILHYYYFGVKKGRCEETK